MARVIISPSKIINALWEVLGLAVDPSIKPFGEGLADPQTFGKKDNRLFFEIEDTVNPLLVKQENDYQIFNFQGKGSIIYYQSSFNERSTASLIFDDTGYSATSPDGHTVDISISPDFDFEPSGQLEFRGYMVKFPFTFFAQIKEQPDSVGFLRDFEFTLVQEKI